MKTRVTNIRLVTPPIRHPSDPGFLVPHNQNKDTRGRAEQPH
jgi:hypothetical protein